jgi:hypothetical protein
MTHNNLHAINHGMGFCFISYFTVSESANGWACACCHGQIGRTGQLFRGSTHVFTANQSNPSWIENGKVKKNDNDFSLFENNF